MNGLPTGRAIAQLLLTVGVLLACSGGAFAADPVGAVTPAHGPMLMLYVRQPLQLGASRVYGLRLDQGAPSASQSNVPSATSSFYANSPRRSLVDLQIRRRADIRLAFGNRVTWDWGSREFQFPNARAQTPIDFAAPSNRAAPAVSSFAPVSAWQLPPSERPH